MPCGCQLSLIRVEVCWQSVGNCKEDRWGSFATIIIIWNTLTSACALSGGQSKIVHVPINVNVYETTEPENNTGKSLKFNPFWAKHTKKSQFPPCLRVWDSKTEPWGSMHSDRNDLPGHLHFLFSICVHIMLHFRHGSHSSTFNCWPI